MIVTDSEAVPAFERALAERHRGLHRPAGGRWAAARTGLKAGDRVHPGASSLVFTVVPEAEMLETTLAALRRARDEAGVASAHARSWAFDVDEVA